VGDGGLFQIENRRELVSRLGENELQNANREILYGGHTPLFPDLLAGSINFPMKSPDGEGLSLADAKALQCDSVKKESR